MAAIKIQVFEYMHHLEVVCPTAPLTNLYKLLLQITSSEQSGDIVLHHAENYASCNALDQGQAPACYRKMPCVAPHRTIVKFKHKTRTICAPLVQIWLD